MVVKLGEFYERIVGNFIVIIIVFFFFIFIWVKKFNFFLISCVVILIICGDLGCNVVVMCNFLCFKCWVIRFDYFFKIVFFLCVKVFFSILMYLYKFNFGGEILCLLFGVFVLIGVLFCWWKFLIGFFLFLLLVVELEFEVV